MQTESLKELADTIALDKDLQKAYSLLPSVPLLSPGVCAIFIMTFGRRRFQVCHVM